MRKIRVYIVVSIFLLIGMTADNVAYGGFGFGLTGAVKNKVEKVDEKVRAKLEAEKDNQDSTQDDNSGNDDGIQDPDPAIIVLRSPEDGNTDVICDSDITVEYSADLDTTTIDTQTVKVKKGTVTLAGTVACSSTTITFTPSAVFEHNSTFTVTLSGIKDEAGNGLGNSEWSFETGRIVHLFQKGKGGYYFNPPVMDDSGNFYIGTSRNGANTSDDNYIFKLDAALDILWEYYLGRGNEVIGSAGVDDSGNSYYPVMEDKTTSAQMHLYKLNSSGQLIWKSTISATAINIDHQYLVPQLSADGTKIYIGGDRLHCFSSDGKLLWKYPNYDSSKYLVAAIDSSNFMYLANEKLDLSKTPADAGFTVWNSTSGATAGPSVLSKDESRVYVTGNGTEKVICMSASDGLKQWEFSVTPWKVAGDQIHIWNSPVIDDNGYLYLGTKTQSNVNSVFFCLAPDGSLEWKNEDFNDDTYCTAALGDDGTVYIGSENSGLRKLDRTTGNVLWQTSVYGGDITYSSPIISSDGLIYVGTMGDSSNGGYFHAIKGEATGYLSGAAWPRFGGGNKSTGRVE